MKRIFSVLLVVGLLAAMVIGAPIASAQSYKDDDNKRVTICHYPPGNPENVQIITVSENALPAHFEHGDVVLPKDKKCPPKPKPKY